ncbi:MAG: minor capsid protein [Chitinophagales bacterium]|nr:minor capsid protein [Chitinophagales bacterium]
MKEVYDGKRKAGELSEEHILATYEKLNQGAKSGYGKYYSIVNSEGTPNHTVINMKQNLYKFSAAKDSDMMEKINHALYDGDRLKSFDEFMADVNKLNILYNRNWLSTEYRTARQAAQTAAQWEAFQKNKELFPNLKYMTQQDNDVRLEHEALDGVIAPIDSSFWAENYPPNGWNCRCYVVQTAEPAWNKIPDTSKVVKPEFKGNTGISGQIFNEDSETGQPFFALAKSNPNWEKLFELSKLYAPYEDVKTSKDGVVKVSIYAHEVDKKKNLNYAKVVVGNHGGVFEILPHVEINGKKNPEYRYNGVVGDRTQFNGSNIKAFITTSFQKCKEGNQLGAFENRFLALDFQGKLNLNNYEDMVAQLNSKIQKVDFIILRNGNKSLIDKSKGFNQYKLLDKIKRELL